MGVRPGSGEIRTSMTPPRNRQFPPSEAQREGKPALRPPVSRRGANQQVQGCHDDFLILLYDVARHMRTYADQIASIHGMTRAQWIILARLERQPDLSQNELAALAEVAPITASRLVDRLEELGLVKRCADPKDRRIWRLQLTPEAAPILRNIERFRVELHELMTKEIDPWFLDAMVIGLHQKKKNLSSSGRAAEASGTINRGFCSCSLPSPLAHLTIDPERMCRIDPKDFQFLAKERQLLQRARQPRLLRMGLDIGQKLGGGELPVDHVAFELGHIDAIGGETAERLVERRRHVADPENKARDDLSGGGFRPLRGFRKHNETRRVMRFVLDVGGEHIEAMDFRR